MTDTSYLTKIGFEKLKKEIVDLKLKSKQLLDTVIDAKEQGDLRENAGYQYAREKHAGTLAKLRKLEKRLMHAKILDSKSISTQFVCIGTSVKLEDIRSLKVFEYTLVASEESDPASGKISVGSPIGSAMLEAQIGSTIEVCLPKQKKKYLIKEIKKSIDV